MKRITSRLLLVLGLLLALPACDAQTVADGIDVLSGIAAEWEDTATPAEDEKGGTTVLDGGNDTSSDTGGTSSQPANDPLYLTGEESPVTQGDTPVTEDNTPVTGDNTFLPENSTYSSAEDVALYIHTYGELPDFYITKNEARDLGWPGGSLEPYAPGCAIGGDVFGNREGLLPSAQGRTYYECDIGTVGADSRGAERLVFSNDGLIYHTEDHYESFSLLYGEENP